MKKKLKKFMLLVLAVILTGCGNAENKQPESSNPDNSPETEMETESDLSDDTTAAEDEETDKELWQEDMNSCLILEDEESIYVCGTYKLLKINKESKEELVLWENSNGMYRQTAYLYSEGSGLLLNNRIYFIEAWTEDDGETENKALAVIGTDGSGYQRIHQMSGDNYMLVMDGRLYIGGFDDVLCCEVFADGTLSELKNIEDVEGCERIPEGYSQLTYHDNGYRTLFAAQALKDMGYLLLRNTAYELVKVIPETGEECSLADQIGNIEAYNSKYFLTSKYNEGWEWYLADKETLEEKFLAVDEHVANIIFMDEEYIYVEYENITDERKQYIYEKISLQTGEWSVIFTEDKTEGMGDFSPEYLSDIVMKNGYLYYAGIRDYKLYLIRRNLAEPSKEEILGEAFYDSGISQVGAIESYHAKIFSESNPDIMLTQTDLEWLHVSERFEGAEEINRCLEEYQKNNIAYEESNAEWLEEDTEEYGEYIIYNSYSSTLSEIAYFDEKYLSFCQQDYDYTGGAHGMPIWTGFTFDLETGQRLGLKDIIGNSEEELKDIVTEYFAEYIGENPDNFWDDAVDYVREYTSFDSDYYLTEEGIKFYFSPYALSSYAAGFQEATIPYEEFEMKISLNKA